MLCCYLGLIFVLNDTATTEIYTYGHTRSLHDALPILAPTACEPVKLIPAMPGWSAIAAPTPPWPSTRLKMPPGAFRPSAASWMIAASACAIAGEIGRAHV